MDSRFKYPLLDGIIRIVHKNDSSLVSSEIGPDTTIQRDFPSEDLTEFDSAADMTSGSGSHPTKKHRLLSDLDLVDYLSKHYSKHSGHITFDEINAMKLNELNVWIERDFNDMSSEFSVLCSSLAESKQVFRDWSSLTTLVDVKQDPRVVKRLQSLSTLPIDYSLWRTEGLYSSYLENMSLIPVELQTHVGVMFGMIQAVTLSDQQNFQENTSTQEKNNLFSKYNQYDGDDNSSAFPEENVQPLSELVGDSPPPSLSVSAGTLPVPDPILVLEDGDKSSIRSVLSRRYALQPDPSSNSLGSNERPETGSPRAMSPSNDLRPLSIPPMAKRSCLDLISFESTAILYSQIPRILGQNGLPLKPLYNRVERSVMETELLTFSQLSSSDVHRFNILQTCEKMIERVLPKLPNFTGQKIGDALEDTSVTRRKFFRQIPAYTLPQALSRDLRTDPVIIREYYPLTDQLLLSYVWIPPHRRMSHKEWKLSSFMRVKPTYEEFRILREKENYTPRTAGGLKHSINITAAELEKHTVHRTVMTPSDNSIVDLNIVKSSGDSWISVSVKDTLIGLRSTERLKLPKVHDTHDHGSRRIEIDEELGQACGGIFFCHGEDDVRITASIEKIPLENIRKPDGKYFVRTTMTDPSGLIVAVNTDGVVTITPSDLLAGSKHPFGFEKSRSILSGGVVSRILEADYIYSRDIMLPDGSRIILRGAEDGEKKKKPQKVVKKSMSKAIPTPTKKTITEKSDPPEREKETKEIFVAALVRDAPDDWSYLHLGADGSINFYAVSTDSPDGVKQPNRRLPFEKIKNIRKSYIDGETKSEIFEYRDGRLVINWANEDLRETRFLDGTRIVTQLVNKTVYVEKLNSQYPSVEIDVEIDKMCRKHSRGQQVPIAMGGERIRSRVALPDGTAIFIKYNTKVTAQYNGSMKIVRRNRESILLEDGGIVTYFPPSSWSNQNESEFIQDCGDSAKPRHTPFQTKGSLPASGEATKGRITEGRGTKKSESKGPGTTQTSLTNKKPLPPTRAKSSDTNKSTVLRTLPVESPTVNMDTQLVKHVERTDNTKYIFHLTKLSCRIEDHENNVFDLDYFNPYEPKLSLAGEVDGLKPKAITEKTIEARVYVVNRSGNAIEVVRSQDIEDLEVAMKLSPDSMKYISDAKFPPCDLGGAKLHTYFKRRRVGVEDTFKFNEIYTPRFWHQFDLPTAALILLDKTRKKITSDNLSATQKIYEVRTLIEYPPLSSRGYEELKDSFQRWNKWRSERLTTLERFQSYDPRTEEDLKAEKEIATKLRKAYKAAKAIVHKKREKEREKAAANQPPNSTKLDLTVIQEEGNLEDIPEYSDYEEEEDGEEVEFVEDPESVEIRESFENYAVSFDDNVNRIPMENLRGAFVQVFNRFVTDAEIQTGLEDDVIDRNKPRVYAQYLSIEEYRRLYFKLKGPDGFPTPISSVRDGYAISRVDSEEPKEPPVKLNTTLQTPANRQPNISERNFWQTNFGIEAQSQLHGSNEDLQWERNNGITFSIDETDERRAAGSAIHAARFVSRNSS